MLLAGAAPESTSLTQLQQVLCSSRNDSKNDISLKLDALQNSIHALTTSLISGNGQDDLEVSDANSAWIKAGLTLQPDFVETLKTYFNADTDVLKTAQAVNAWVSKATHEKITSIVDDSIVQQASLILINAIYFKAKWLVPFAKPDTQPLDFYFMDNKVQQVPMMYLAHSRGAGIEVAKFTTTALSVSGGKNSNVECLAVKMSYKGGQYSAIAAMPVADLQPSQAAGSNSELQLASGQKYTAPLAACHSHVVSSLTKTKGNTAAATDNLQWKGVSMASGISKIKLYLPRFEIEYSVALSQMLQQTGLDAIFKPAGEFTRIATDSKSGNTINDLFVSEVMHKVYCKMDEQGTEAAAATAIMMVRAAILPQATEEILVKFDRPFSFSVVHNETGLALFSGEVLRPELWKGA